MLYKTNLEIEHKRTSNLGSHALRKVEDLLKTGLFA